MRIVIQRVTKASVTIEEKNCGAIGTGFLVLVGIEETDQEEDVNYLVPKLCQLRVFADAEGKMNLDIRQTGGELLIISQFTLHASTKKGNRPSFIKAARPEKAIPLYEKFVSECSHFLGKECKTGVFGADMKVELINDGPVTIIIDSREKE